MKSIDEMNEAELDAYLAKPTPAPAPQAPSKSIDEMNEQELDAYLAKPDAQPEKGMLEKANDYFQAIPDNRGPSKEPASAFADGQGVTVESAHESFRRAKDTMMPGGDSETGWLGRIFYGLSMPEQYLARQATVALTSLGQMKTEDAKALLSQEDMHFSDIVNHYWRDPKSMGERTLRFGVGLGMDILFDPLSYVGIGALTKLGRTAEVAGKTVNLSKVSKAERGFFKAAEKIEDLTHTLTPENFLVKAGETAEDVAMQVSTAVENFTGKKIGILELRSNLQGKVSNETLQKVNKAYAKEMNKGFFEQIATGERGLTVGFKVPFTSLGAEIDVPLAKSITQPLGKVFYENVVRAGEKFLKPLRFSKPITTVARAWNNIFTKTGFEDFDMQKTLFHGNKNLLDDNLTKLETNWRTKLKGANQEDIDDIVEEIERWVPDPAATAKKHGFDTPEAAKHLMPTEADLARQTRLTEKGYLDIAREARKLMDDKALEYSRRPGIPFEELNPFSYDANGVFKATDARNYVKHMVTREFKRKYKNTTDAIEYGISYLKEAGHNVDDSALGRRYRGYIKDANQASLEKHGVKMFVDDPVELVTRRLREMDQTIRNYDLLQAAVPHALVFDKGSMLQLPAGYMKFDLNRMNLLTEDKLGVKAFVPDFYKSGRGIYLPETIADSLKFNVSPQEHGEFVNALSDANDLFMHVFRNTALFGTGYLGMNMFSNLLTYVTAGVSRPAKTLVDSIKMFTPGMKDAKFAIKTIHGDEMILSRDELWDLAVQHNVVRGSGASTLNKPITHSQLAENIASTFKANEKIGKVISTVGEAATLWGINRFIATHSDDIPRVGLFLDRLNDGFSVAAAAEAVEKAFYNFNDIGSSSKVIRTMMPFSSFPIKTVERVMSDFKSGHIGTLTLPGKVRPVLEGAFVPDADVREALNMALPEYYAYGDKHHGILLPGQVEVLNEVPWALGATSFLLNPQNAFHPVLQILGAGISAKSEKDFTDFSFDDWWKETADMLIKHVPVTIREGLALGEMNGWIDAGGHFARLYEGRTPVTHGQIVGFKNAAEFGNWLEKNREGDFLYQMLFPETLTTHEDASDIPLVDLSDGEAANTRRLVQRGGWIRKHFRDLTLGLASMSRMDLNYVLNMNALKRQLQKEKFEIRKSAIEAGQLPDPNLTEEKIEHLAENSANFRNYLNLTKKRAVLTGYYNWYLGVEKQYPDSGAWDMMFDPEKRYRFDTEGKADMKQAVEEISPESVLSEMIESIKSEEAPAEEAPSYEEQ